MGMAYRAPDRIYKRHCEVTEHAVDRLLDRYRTPEDVTYRDREDLGNKIDEAVYAHLKGAEKVLDRTHLPCQDRLPGRGVPTLIVDCNETDVGLYAVVRENESRSGSFSYCVVTLLTEKQCVDNKMKGNWTDMGGQIIQMKAFGTLGDKFKGITIAPTPAKEEAPITSITPIQPPPAPQKEMRVLRFWGPGATVEYRELLLAEVSDFVIEALERNPEVKIEIAPSPVWKPVKTRVVVDVD